MAKKPKQAVDHKTRRVAREAHDTLCDEPRCKFRGERIQQGVCYSAEGDLIDFARLAAEEKQLQQELAWIKKQSPGKKYVATLEAYYVSIMLNWQSTLDECVKLRRDLALLRRKKRSRK